MRSEGMIHVVHTCRYGTHVHQATSEPHQFPLFPGPVTITFSSLKRYKTPTAAPPNVAPRASPRSVAAFVNAHMQQCFFCAHPHGEGDRVQYALPTRSVASASGASYANEGCLPPSLCFLGVCNQCPVPPFFFSPEESPPTQDTSVLYTLLS